MFHNLSLVLLFCRPYLFRNLFRKLLELKTSETKRFPPLLQYFLPAPPAVLQIDLTSFPILTDLPCHPSKEHESLPQNNPKNTSDKTESFPPVTLLYPISKQLSGVLEK